jgi:hypothetical protein
VSAGSYAASLSGSGKRARAEQRDAGSGAWRGVSFALLSFKARADLADPRKEAAPHLRLHRGNAQL